MIGKNKHLIEAILLFIIGTVFFLNSEINIETFYVFNFLGLISYLTAIVQISMYFFNIK